MAKKSLITSSEVRSVTNTSTNDTSTKRMLYPPRMSQPSLLWLWIVSLLILGVIIFGGVSYIAFNWFKTIHITLGTGNTTQPPITTFDVNQLHKQMYLSLLDQSQVRARLDG